jgi:hypothetical protein
MGNGQYQGDSDQMFTFRLVSFFFFVSLFLSGIDVVSLDIQEIGSLRQFGTVPRSSSSYFVV